MALTHPSRDQKNVSIKDKIQSEIKDQNEQAGKLTPITSALLRARLFWALVITCIVLGSIPASYKFYTTYGTHLKNYITKFTKVGAGSNENEFYDKLDNTTEQRKTK